MSVPRILVPGIHHIDVRLKRRDMGSRVLMDALQTLAMAIKRFDDDPVTGALR